MKIVSKLLIIALIFSGSAITMLQACGGKPWHSHDEEKSELADEEEETEE